jgi:hypothetical protein
MPLLFSAHRVRPARVLLALVAVLVTSCVESSLLPPSNGQLALGTWGGDNSGIIVTDSAAHVHVGCTFGDMPGNIQLDATGRFTINGSYVLRAYPVQVGPPLPAQFSGRVIGRTLTLAIAVNDTVEKKVVAMGPITVVYGRQPQVGPCPICRAPSRWP